MVNYRHLRHRAAVYSLFSINTKELFPLFIAIVVFSLISALFLMSLSEGPVNVPNQVLSNDHSSIRDVNLTIIAIGCNRVDGLLRTLNSVKNANVPQGALLHICVDACGVPEVGSLANEFDWPFGEKKVTLRHEQFGLAKHIANCWEDPLPGQWALFVEDDVIIAPLAFSAFNEALNIRAKHDYASNIIGVGVHDSRVNQYCWKDRIHAKPCPHVQKACNTSTTTYSELGTLLCLGDQSRGSWILGQMPSSWGAFYEGKAWSIFKEYYLSRAQLSVGEAVVVAVPHSFANEWNHSWKRFLLELMFNAGWTFMYRTDLNHVGFSTTLRTSGVHTLKNEKLKRSEMERKCLVCLPLENATYFVADNALINSANQINSFDYCSGETSVQKLIMQGAASTFSMSKHFGSDHAHPNSKMPEHYPELVQCLQFLQQANMEARNRYNISIGEKSGILSSGYDVAFLEKAEIIMVTSSGSLDRDCNTTVQQFEIFGGLVHFIVAAPPKVCRKLMRGNIHATCLDEAHFLHKDGNRLPVIRQLLQAAAQAALPKVKWIGIMNGDITFDKTLVDTLVAVSKSEVCAKNDAHSRCAVTGQRVDVDWTTNKEKLHAVWGMDYFIFNSAGLEFVLQDGVLPPFTIGRVRWDSWLMGFLATSDEITTIDVSNVMKVRHFMHFHDTFLSKKSDDLWNLKLADEKFRLGRTDHAQFSVNNVTGALVPLLDTKKLQKKLETNFFKYDFAAAVERETDFKYSAGAVPTEYFRCFCDLLTLLAPSEITNLSLGKYCEPNSAFLKYSRKLKVRSRVFFFKEIFEMAGGMKPDDLNLNKSTSLLNFLPGANVSKCCVLTHKSDAPDVIPGRFWIEEQGSKSSQCLVDASYM